MPKKQNEQEPQERQGEPEVFEPVEDERGRLRLDRRLTPAEAAAQDAEHREMFEQNRRERFGSPDAPHKSAA
jgi:hypothetical protein